MKVMLCFILIFFFSVFEVYDCCDILSFCYHFTSLIIYDIYYVFFTFFVHFCFCAVYLVKLLDIVPHYRKVGRHRF
uniref:Secreted peptide n=1 Tax=Rhipicephalus pulchellus TaxID=72859 RepID=L7M5F3_RHIPC